MVNFVLSLITIFFLNSTATVQNIEKAFLQNNPTILYNLFSEGSHINISLPEPIFFSDQLSSHQAYFMLKKIFNSFETFEFYSDKQPFSPEEGHLIVKARWSFRDKKNNDQFLFHVFFYLKSQDTRNSEESGTVWKITEIKAEKI